MTPPDDTSTASFDWHARPERGRRIDVVDSTFCDALRAPVATGRSLQDKRRLLSLMSVLGFRSVVPGHPGVGVRHCAHVLDSSRELVRVQAPIDASCTSRSMVKDVAATLDARKRSGRDVDIASALPVSPVLLRAEVSNLDRLQQSAESPVLFAMRAGARVMRSVRDAR